MNLDEINPECFVLALFIRDDGERFLLGSGAYVFKDSQQHFEANNYANDIVEVQGNDGVFLAGQVRRPTTQPFDGYIGDATVAKEDVERYRRNFFAFFRKDYYYTVVYIFPNGAAIQRRKGFIVDAPEVKELYQFYPEYHIALNFEDINYYSYSEDESGQEIYTKSATIYLSAGVGSGGLVWGTLGAVSSGYSLTNPVSFSGTSLTIDNELDISSQAEITSLYGDTEQAGTPTPASTQEIKTVTGVQTVTVNSTNYTVDLGSIELCKIGDYQDYIYRSGDDWYLHQEVGKYTITGNESDLGIQNNTRIFIGAPRSGIPLPIFNPTNDSKSGIYCSNLVESTPYYTWAGREQGIAYEQGTEGSTRTRGFDIYISGITTLADYKAAIAGYKIVYKLKDFTDTEITDATLLQQLDALGAVKITAGENSIDVTSAKLPAEIAGNYYTGVDYTGAGYVWEAGSGGGPTTVMVDSIDRVYPIWELTGPAENPQISVLSTGTTLRYAGTITSSQTLVIDMFNKTAKLNGASVIGNVTGDWVYFTPGNNRVTYTADNADANPSQIYWQEVVG